MEAQDDFDKIIELLPEYRKFYPFIDAIVESCRTSTVYLHCIRGNSKALTREQIYGIYTIRARIQEENRPAHPLNGFDSLLENLKSTKHGEVALSILSTDRSTVIIFLDQGFTEIIGILYSDVVLEKEKQQDGKLFIKGRLQQS